VLLAPVALLTEEQKLVVHYHFGDDVGQADPNFDDSAWPAASQSGWPSQPSIPMVMCGSGAACHAGPPSVGAEL